jgi:Tol biopolymer transport system component
MPKHTIFKVLSALLLLSATFWAVLFEWNKSVGKGRWEDPWIDVSPSGALVVFSAEGEAYKSLYLLNTIDMTVSRLTNSANYDNYPAFSPNGKEIVFQRGPEYDGPTHLMILDLLSKHETQLTKPSSYGDLWPRYTNDGKSVVFIRSPARYNYDIFSVKPDGSELRQLTSNQADGYQHPTSISSGAGIWYCHYLPSPQYDKMGEVSAIIESVSNRGLLQTNPINFGRVNCDPYFFRQGKTIAFISDPLSDRAFDVCTCNTSGTPKPICLHTSKLVNWAGNPSAPADGHCIYFTAGNPSEIWCINSNGSGERRIADNSIFTNPMGWKAP